MADNSELRSMLPFAIVGSEDEAVVNGERVRARSYPWGVVEVENPQHSDFTSLRSALLSTHLADLKEITVEFLYENYRTEKLSRSVNPGYPDGSVSGIDQINQSQYKEDQLDREEDKLREMELKVQREILQRRQELAAQEESLRNLEARLAASG